jgi:hypothetical protein
MNSPTQELRRRLEAERDALNTRVQALYLADAVLRNNGLEGEPVDNIYLGEGIDDLDPSLGRIISMYWERKGV